MGMKPSTISTLKKAAETPGIEGPDRQLPLKAILNWAIENKVPVDWLLTGEEPPRQIAEAPDIVFLAQEEGGQIRPRTDMEGNYIAVPLLTDSVAAGAPAEVNETDVESWAIIYKDKAWLPHAPENYTCVRVRGKSMYPVLDDGDIVAIDHAVRPSTKEELRGLCGKMAAFRVDDGVTIKWLKFDFKSGTVVGVPENDAEMDHLVVLKGEEINEGIVGIVRWWWSKR